MEKACVVIPEHRERLSGIELESFEHNIKILKNYDIILVCGDNLNTSFYEGYGINKIERFSDDYFKNVRGYNLLVVTADFYKRFEDYEYMLICQNDAYVFKDELTEWCNKGYDYIGAPWLEHMYHAEIGDIYGKSGNGGFCLRNVSNLIGLITENEELINNYFRRGIPEDVILSCIGNLKRPTAIEAALFSFEMNPNEAYRLTNGKPPFGSHQLYRFNSELFNKLKVQ